MPVAAPSSFSLTRHNGTRRWLIMPGALHVALQVALQNLIITSGFAAEPAPTILAPAPAPAGMVWIPAGEFAMGSDQPNTNNSERPIHNVRVSGFWLDATEVTNAQFAAFVAATGFKTTAEKPVDWEEIKKQLPAGTPKPADEVLAPGAMVFVPTPKPVTDFQAYSQWWKWEHGADWRHPSDPQSSIEGKIIIRSCKFLGMMQWPSPPGPASACRPKRNGNSLRAVASRASVIHGEINY